MKRTSLLAKCIPLVTELQVLANKVDNSNYYYDRAINKADPARAAEKKKEHGSVLRDMAKIMNKLDRLMVKEANRYID